MEFSYKTPSELAVESQNFCEVENADFAQVTRSDGPHIERRVSLSARQSLEADRAAEALRASLRLPLRFTLRHSARAHFTSEVHVRLVEPHFVTEAVVRSYASVWRRLLFSKCINL